MQSSPKRISREASEDIPTFRCRTLAVGVSRTLRRSQACFSDLHGPFHNYFLISSINLWATSAPAFWFCPVTMVPSVTT